MICKQCPSGWIINLGHCYYVYRGATDWYTARSWCQGQGADLMIIRSQAEYNLVQTFYNTYIGGGGLFIGGYYSSKY